jgi:hypothetical protein
MGKCWNCGLPSGSLTTKGMTIQIQLAAGYGEKRLRKSTVETCCQECAIQALAASKYGHQTSKWPVTLAQARTIIRREMQREPRS